MSVKTNKIKRGIRCVQSKTTFRCIGREPSFGCNGTRSMILNHSIMLYSTFYSDPGEATRPSQRAQQKAEASDFYRRMGRHCCWKRVDGYSALFLSVVVRATRALGCCTRSSDCWWWRRYQYPCYRLMLRPAPLQ